MKIIYQADDGAKFDNEVECRIYEKSIKMCKAISEKRVRMLTYDKRVVEEKDLLNYKELASLMGDIFYFRCNDKEILEILSNYFAEDFEENVTYMYDDENNRWRELDDYIFNYRSLISNLIKAQTTIMDGITT